MKESSKRGWGRGGSNGWTIMAKVGAGLPQTIHRTEELLLQPTVTFAVTSASCSYPHLETRGLAFAVQSTE